MHAFLRRTAIATAATALVLGLAGGAWAGTVELSGYQVEPGDTLYGIAAHELGSGARWTEIAKLNGLTATSGIRPGEILRLPPRHERDATAGAGPGRAPSAAIGLARSPQLVHVGHGYEASAISGEGSDSPSRARRERRMRDRNERVTDVEIVPRGHVVMVLPARPAARLGRRDRRDDRADLPVLPGAERGSMWELADGMAFLIGLAGTFLFWARGMKRLLTKRVAAAIRPSHR